MSARGLWRIRPHIGTDRHLRRESLWEALRGTPQDVDVLLDLTGAGFVEPGTERMVADYLAGQDVQVLADDARVLSWFVAAFGGGVRER